MDYNKLAELLFPHIDKTPEYYEEHFPKRVLPEGAKVTRLGPSPTGFIHLGNLYGAFADERLAHQSGGVFYLRIEDTDDKRYVEGAVETIIKSLDFFGINFDEGALLDGETGSYGPYYQSRRGEIYQCFAKEMVKKGQAYPCFLTEDEINEIRAYQEANKLNPGIYGQFAKCRDMSLEEIQSKIDAGIPYVVRLKSDGNTDEPAHISVEDGIRGELSMPENTQDTVILKTNGIPTYHFAHVIDDHFMRTTHVVRGEEWLSTFPWHLQLFEYIGLPESIMRSGEAAGVVPTEYREKLKLEDLSCEELLSFTSAISDFYDKLSKYYSESDVAKRIGYEFNIIESSTQDGQKLWAVLAESLTRNIGDHAAIINIGQSVVSDWYNQSNLHKISQYLKDSIPAA